MQRIVSRYVMGTLALGLISCAGASSQHVSQGRPATSQRPSQIIVYHLAVDPADVSLNQSIIQRGYRNVSGTDETAKQRQLALDGAEDVCLGVVTQLEDKGYNAVCQARGTQIYGSNVLIVDGEFTNLSEGNRLRRTVIGLGSGQSAIDTSVNVYQRTGTGTALVLQFDTHADSGKMPGAVIMGAPGMAAGGSAAIASAGVNVAAGAVKAHRSSLGSLGDMTTDQIVNSVTNYCLQQGWASGQYLATLAHAE